MSAWTDLRFALRGLRRDRAYTIVALLTLAFGIAANTVIFSIVDGVLLKPLQYKDPGRLVVVNEVVAELANAYPRLPAAARHYFYWREHAASFEQVAIIEGDRAVLTGAGEPQQLEAARVSANLLPMLGVRARAGRLFVEAEDAPGRDKVVVISEGLWQHRFGGNPRVIGQAMTLDGVPRTVIGVVPASFHLPKSQIFAIVGMPSKADVWVPIAIRRESLNWFGPFNYSVIGRLKPGIPVRQALAELDTQQSAIAANLPDKLHLRALVTPLQEDATGSSRKPLLMLLAAVGVVLLIVCVNLANLALARGTARQRDIAVRRALGATGGQLARGVIMEALVLAACGGLLGALLSWAGLRLVLAGAPVDLPRLDEVRLDARVMLFALGLSVLSGLLFGLLPAWRAAAADPQRSLRDGGRSTTEGRSGGLLRQGLVAAESALGALLLVVAGLLVASFFNLLNVDKGFDTARLLATRLTLPRNSFASGDAREAYFRDVLRRLEATPGVVRAGLISTLPLQGEDWVDLVQKEGEHRPTAELPPTNYRFCSAGYFQAAGIPFVQGGTFADTDKQRNLAVISEATARVLWPGEAAVGKRFNRNQPDEPAYEVAGVVRDVSVGLDRQAVPTVYVPFWSKNERPTMNVVLRSAADPRAVARSVRQAVWGVNPDTVVGEIRTMDGLVADSVAGRRFQVLLTGGFALSALLLACVGIYGVVSWSMARRQNEIGVRMALGARSGDVQRMVIAQGLRPVIAGVVLGLAVALALGGVMSSLLFGVSARDPVTYAVVALTLSAVAALACYIPARRATLADPLRSLRYE